MTDGIRSFHADLHVLFRITFFGIRSFHVDLHVLFRIAFFGISAATGHTSFVGPHFASVIDAHMHLHGVYARRHTSAISIHAADFGFPRVLVLHVHGVLDRVGQYFVALLASDTPLESMALVVGLEGGLQR